MNAFMAVIEHPTQAPEYKVIRAATKQEARVKAGAYGQVTELRAL